MWDHPTVYLAGQLIREQIKSWEEAEEALIPKVNTGRERHLLLAVKNC